MDTRGKHGDQESPRRTAEVTTDTGSVQIVELGTVGPQRRGTRTVALVAIGALLVVSAAGVLALTRPTPTPTATPSTSGPVAFATEAPTPAPTPTAPPTSRPTATPRPTPGSWVWDAYDVAGFSQLTHPRHVWAFGNRFVALLATSQNGDAEDGLQSLLVSTDGSSWARAVPPAPGFEVELGVVFDQALWLVGQGYSDGSRAREAWATTNGTTWNRAITLESMISAAGEVLALARGPSGWVALCSTTRELDAAPVVEVRRELAEGGWDAVDLPLDMHERAAGMVGNGLELVLLVEHVSDESDGWFDLHQSSDGEFWSLVKVLRPGAEIADMAAGARGFVIVGEETRDAGTHPIGWQSDHGEVWEEGTLPVGSLPPGLSTVGAHRVVATDAGYLAISEPNGMAWSSKDGRTWSAFNVWPTVNDFMVDVAVVDDVVVALRANLGRVGFLRGRLSGLRAG